MAWRGAAKAPRCGFSLTRASPEQQGTFAHPSQAPPASELTLGATTYERRTVTRPSSKQNTRNEIAPLLDTGNGRGRSEARVLVAVAAAAAAVPAAAAAASITTAAAASVAALAVPAAAASPTTSITATAAVAAAAAAPTSITTASITAAATIKVAALLRLELGQDLADLERELVEVLLLAEG